MGLRTILVPMAGDDADGRALAAAGAVARQHGSHITALFAEPDPRDIPMAMVGDATGGYLSRDLVRNLESRIDARKATAIRVFQEWQSASGIPLGQTPVEGPSATFVREVGTDAVLVRGHGLITDLIVTILPGPAEVERSVFIETGLFDAGKPILAVPRGTAPLPPADAPVQIVWRPAPESARAMTAALPFLAGRRDIIVSTAVNAGDRATNDVVVAYLSWHGFTARPVVYPGPRDGARLLAEAQKSGVGLLVLGAYVNSRARSLVFGGVTRHVLENATIPILIAH